ncbi:hypothetical protein [Flexivirga oryzae]|uniref:Nucleoid-associated protein YgaU n=1 Tax=Flexivirga oryzae TaxID=1794944 RepID=A0A839N3A4_9MICO|nr:hypothetical protein [Flexivirga oryzae]MBB2890554.1 nucleoid-associated protein YgaU [Flexivirga oryzae]
MSALAQWDAPADPRPARRHLRAVPTGPQACGGGRAVGVRVQSTGLRLTARGRRLIGVVVAAALLVGAGAAAKAWATTPAAAPRGVTVQSGQTLSEIAHRAYPSMLVSDAVTKVALANDLNSLQVVAGEHLQLPR